MRQVQAVVVLVRVGACQVGVRVFVLQPDVAGRRANPVLLSVAEAAVQGVVLPLLAARQAELVVAAVVVAALEIGRQPLVRRHPQPAAQVVGAVLGAVTQVRPVASVVDLLGAC